MLKPGTYPATVALTQTDQGEVACQFGESKEKGTPFAAVLCRVLRGPSAKQTITWQGYFSGGATEHTVKALRNFGFKGDDLAAFADQRPENEVEIVVKEERSQDGTKTFVKVAWVNVAGRGMKIEAPIAGGELRKFSAKLKASLKGAPEVVTEKAVVQDPSAGADEHSQPPPADDVDQSPQGKDTIPF